MGTPDFALKPLLHIERVLPSKSIITYYIQKRIKFPAIAPFPPIPSCLSEIEMCFAGQVLQDK